MILLHYSMPTNLRERVTLEWWSYESPARSVTACTPACGEGIGKIKPLFTPSHPPASAHPLPPCARWGGAGTAFATACAPHPVAPASPPAVVPSSSAPSGGRLAQPALAASRRRLALRGLSAGQAAPLGLRGGQWFQQQLAGPAVDGFGQGLPGLHLRGAAIVLHPHRTIEDQGCRPPACGACSPAR
jgi:hypothetical protein